MQNELHADDKVCADCDPSVGMTCDNCIAEAAVLRASLPSQPEQGQIAESMDSMVARFGEKYTEGAPDPAKADPEILAALRDAKELLARTFPEDFCRDGCDECGGYIEDCPGNCPVRTAPPLVERLSAILATQAVKP